MVLDDVNHVSQLYMRNAKNPRILLVVINNGIGFDDRCDLGKKSSYALGEFHKRARTIMQRFEETGGGVGKRKKVAQKNVKNHKKTQFLDQLFFVVSKQFAEMAGFKLLTVIS